MNAVLDACVLYSANLRDFFMHLTAQLVFQPKWTERIHSEWLENVLTKRPDISRAQLERTRNLMNQYGRDWHVPQHEALMLTLSLPDTGDTHVLAAAIAAGVPLIVTFNLSDFPASALAPHGIQAQPPDDFACDLFDEAPEAFLLAVRTHRATLKHPPRTAGEYLQRLHQSGLPQTALRLQSFAAQI